jgi:hypothetical protein
MNNITKYTTQDELLVQSLMNFYKVEDNGHKNENLDKMLRIITGESRISLRIVDWFTTNYAKKYYTCYNIQKPSFTRRFKVYNEYKNELRSYSKKKFDPFCRWERISIPYKDGKYIETTIGQLNFFKWAIVNKIIDYIETNYELIEKDMIARNSTAKRKEIMGNEQTKTRKKREELSISASKNIKKEKVEIVVQFN